MTPLRRMDANAVISRVFPTKTKNLSTVSHIIKRASGARQGPRGFHVPHKNPAVAGFSPLPCDDEKSRGEKKRKNFTKALAVFFRSEYITATDAADTIRDTRRAISSVGRAPRLHRGCREFESLIAHHFPDPFRYMRVWRRLRFSWAVDCTHRPSGFPTILTRCPRASEEASARVIYPRLIRLPHIPTGSRDLCITP